MSWPSVSFCLFGFRLVEAVMSIVALEVWTLESDFRVGVGRRLRITESVRRRRETGGDSAAGGLREGGEQDRAVRLRASADQCLLSVDVAVLGAPAVELWRRSHSRVGSRCAASVGSRNSESAAPFPSGLSRDFVNSAPRFSSQVAPRRRGADDGGGGYWAGGSGTGLAVVTGLAVGVGPLSSARGAAEQALPPWAQEAQSNIGLRLSGWAAGLIYSEFRSVIRNFGSVQTNLISEMSPSCSRISNLTTNISVLVGFYSVRFGKTEPNAHP
ncbi:unnamed protein product [Linum trigynum]|uniref:Uncharacterized protein n=1 Tax=Linum trigynum TaxID=586398 RepID=A0AAV2FJ99_9ROSI